MVLEERIDFNQLGIGEVLRNNRLAVPVNQREYKWEEEHVSDLFTDLANAIANHASSYFLGTIVLTRGAGPLPEVSDGQQRLATTTILLAAIRNYFYSQNDEARVESLSPFLREIDRTTTELVPKLRLNVDDNEYFTKAILSSPNSPDRRIEATKASHKRIAKAAQLADKHVLDILQPHSDANKTTQLLAWVDFLEKRAQVILLKVPSALNAYVMFETLNDRGLKASQADLIKNYLLSQAGDERVREAQAKWSAMVGALESLDEDDLAVTYLHHVLITKDGPTKERDVLEKVRNFANSSGRALTFLDELADGANDYVALFNPDHRKWIEYGTSTRNHISTITRDLGVQQIRPLMFAISRHFSVREGQKTFRLIVFWSVRLLVEGIRGGQPDRFFSLRAQEIANGTITSAEELTSALANIIPNDAQFETAFASARISKVALARYYLRALERQRKEEREPEWIPNNDEGAINLEHILPENPQEFWDHIDPDKAAAYHRRIGNMVIMQATANSVIGNSSFQQKKEVFRTSAFLLTSEVADYEGWGPDEIEDRQKRLAQLAIQTWPASLRAPRTPRTRRQTGADENRISSPHRI